MKKFCKEYLALQKNILFAPGKLSLYKGNYALKKFCKEYLTLQNPQKISYLRLEIICQ